MKQGKNMKITVVGALTPVPECTQEETGMKSEEEIGMVRDVVQQAALRIRALPPGKWAGWVIYLLEVLEAEIGESQAGQHLFSEVLEDVASDIKGRLRSGEW